LQITCRFRNKAYTKGHTFSKKITYEAAKSGKKVNAIYNKKMYYSEYLKCKWARCMDNTPHL
jgi:hypothetical protein